MDFLEQMDETVKLPIVYYHKFIMSYKKNSDDIYVFCEGDVDLSYYCEQIERLCPKKEIQKYPVECKNNVLQIWRFIDWGQYQKSRVLFFVDRDLSYWVGEQQYYDTNVYITDYYSFENDAVTLHMFLKLLEDLYGFANYTEEEKNGLKDCFIKKWNTFIKGSYALMGFVLYKYQTSHEHVANNISMSKCLNFDLDDIWNKMIDGMPCEEYYKIKLQVVGEDCERATNVIKERFINEENHYSVRGKWCLDFMIRLMNYIYGLGNLYAPSLYEGRIKQPKKIVDLTARGAMAIIGPKIVPPESLIDFLVNNIGEKHE